MVASETPWWTNTLSLCLLQCGSGPNHAVEHLLIAGDLLSAGVRAFDIFIIQAANFSAHRASVASRGCPPFLSLSLSHTDTHTHAHIQTHTHTHTYPHIHTHTHTQTHTRV